MQSPLRKLTFLATTTTLVLSLFLISVSDASAGERDWDNDYSNKNNHNDTYSSWQKDSDYEKDNKYDYGRNNYEYEKQVLKYYLVKVRYDNDYDNKGYWYAKNKDTREVIQCLKELGLSRDEIHKVLSKLGYGYYDHGNNWSSYD